MTVKVESYLTPSEIKTRKRWFLYILIAFGINLLSVGFMLAKALGGANLIRDGFEAFCGFLWAAFWSYLSYYLCYKKQTTFLLTLTLVSMIIGAITFIGILGAATFATPSLLVFFTYIIVGGLVSIPFLIVSVLTLKLRRINKMIRCQRNHPKESDELIQEFRSVSDIESLGTTFRNAMEKTSFLEPLIHREWKMKKRELESLAK